MIANRRHFIAQRALLMVALLVASCCALWAQSDGPPAGGMQHRGGNPDRELQRLTQVLSLTGDQQAQVKTLLAQQREQMRALRNAGSDASGQASPPSREQIEAIRTDTDKKIAALLNDDQKATFAAWQQQRRQRMGPRNGQDGGAAPDSQPPSS